MTCFPSISKALRVSFGNGLRPPLTSSLRKHSGQKPRARQRAWPGYGAIPSTVRAVTGAHSRGSRAAGHRHRVRPRTVEDQRQSAVTVASTVAKPLDKARPMQTTVECWPSAPTATDGPGQCAHSYGSEDRARHVPDQAVDRGSSRPLPNNTAGIPTWLDAGESSCGGDLMRKRSLQPLASLWVARRGAGRSSCNYSSAGHARFKTPRGQVVRSAG